MSQSHPPALWRALPTWCQFQQGTEECVCAGQNPAVCGHLLQIQPLEWAQLQQTPDQVLTLCRRASLEAATAPMHRSLPPDLGVGGSPVYGLLRGSSAFPGLRP